MNNSYIIEWEWDKVYNIIDEKEFYLYLKRLDDIVNHWNEIKHLKPIE